jgi:hypothetical protein
MRPGVEGESASPVRTLSSDREAGVSAAIEHMFDGRGAVVAGQARAPGVPGAGLVWRVAEARLFGTFAFSLQNRPRRARSRFRRS